MHVSFVNKVMSIQVLEVPLQLQVIGKRGIRSNYIPQIYPNI